MSKDYSFNVMPSVSISRSRFARKSQHKTSFNMGQIVPIYVDEVLPGDTRSFDMATLVRMSTPIAPIMDNIYIDYYAFYVPNRLVWTHWKEFMGENNTSAGIPAVSYSVPEITVWGYSADNLCNYFGLPSLGGSGSYKVSALPFRAYYLIYNEWFRNQNIIAPVAVQTGDTDGAIVGSNSNSNTSLRNAAKLADYFTKALPYAQKGQPVSIPLGTSAPVIALNTNTGNVVTANTSMSPVGTLAGFTNGQVGGSYSTTTAKFVADLSTATAATINQLRYAFQLQKLLEKDALYGSRYWEILASHFGIKAPDASLQRPEYLGGFRQNINIDQVLQTTGSNVSTPSSQTLGVPGANSVTGGKASLFTKSFTEHGWIMVVAVARHDQTYAQGVNRMWSRKGRYDFYFPVFANLGAQEIKKKEIFVQGTSVDDEIFGYQEAWAEYRYKPSIATGLLDPNKSGSLSYWTLTNRFGSLPTLGQTFIEQGRDDIVDALVTGSTGPDFIGDFYFMDVAVRPMPMYSIPGLIDHH